MTRPQEGGACSEEAWLGGGEPSPRPRVQGGPGSRSTPYGLLDSVGIAVKHVFILGFN